MASPLFLPVSQPVDIWRDAWGIPHIHAQTDMDAFVALGWVHAQDRLWQMEAGVRKGTGHWAEWVGAEGVPNDRLARLMRCEWAAKRDFGNLGAETREMLERYAQGVNAYVDQGELPVEYKLLKSTPQRWEPWHSIVAMRQIGFLLGMVWMKLLRAAALPALGLEGAAKLRYDDGGNDRACMPYGTTAKRWPIELEQLAPAVADLLQLGAASQTGGGSNNWAVSGAHTPHGKPILMGDPHRELDVPIIYQQAHIRGATFDAIGLTVPGVPGFPHFAHNHHVAWCVTVAFVDLADLYVEQFRDFGREYRTEAGWMPTGRRCELIRVREARDVLLDIHETRHGSVVVGDPAMGTAITLQSAQFLEEDRSLDCLLRTLRARTVPALYEGTRGWGLVDHNVVAIDTAGNIGHRVRAMVPDRPRSNGWLPVPGWTGEHEWRGTVPFEAMPAQLNPEGGRIVTANNRVAADTPWPYLATDCVPSFRAQRIAARLEALDECSIETMAPIFADDLSLPGQLFIEHLRVLPLAGLSTAARALADCIRVWDGHMTQDAPGASAYACLRVTLAAVVAERSGLLAIGEGKVWAPPLTGSAIVSHLWWISPSLLRDDDASLLGGATWPQVLAEALEREAAAERWKTPWGKLHAPQPRHPLSKMFPEAAALLDTHSLPVGGDGDTVLATGIHAGEGLTTVYSSLARYAFDASDWNASRWIVYQGVSGVPGHPHRNDQNEAWAQVRMVPMLTDWARIRDEAGEHWRLMPPTPDAAA